MKEEILKDIELFNKRVTALFEKVCGWLEEEKIEFTKKESDLTLNEAQSGPYKTRRLDVFTIDNEKLFSLVPYGIWIIAAAGRIELEGSSGAETLVYLEGEEGLQISARIGKKALFERRTKIVQGKGWHWMDDRIIGKKPLLTKDILLALLERIN